MSNSSTRATPRPWRALALVSIVAIAVLLRWTPPQRVADLRPWPDALEYEEAARNLYEGRGYLLWIVGDAFPPRYPPGLSLLIAGSFPLVGTAPGSGIWVVLACSVATVTATYVVGSAAGGFLAGIAAALFVAISPLHVAWSRAVMSDVPASAAMALLSAWLISLVGRSKSPVEMLCFGLACGLAANLRESLLIFAPAAAVSLALFGERDRNHLLRQSSAFVVGLAAGLLPLLSVNQWLFGSPFRGGYGYWTNHVQMFSLRWVLSPRATGSPSNAARYLALLFGRGSLYPWPAAILLLVGTCVAALGSTRARALAFLAWSTTLGFFVLHVLFFWQADRFFLPVLPPLAALMGIPFSSGVSRYTRRGAVVLGVLSIVLVFSHPASFAPPDQPSNDAATLKRIRLIAEPNAAIIAHTNPFLFARILRRHADRVWIPLQPDPAQHAVEYKGFKPVRRDPRTSKWRLPALNPPLGIAEAVVAVSRLCRDGRPTYLSEGFRVNLRFLTEIKAMLAVRFGLVRVLDANPYAVYRVRCPARLDLGKN